MDRVSMVRKFSSGKNRLGIPGGFSAQDGKITPAPSGWQAFTNLDVTLGGEFILRNDTNYRIVNQTAAGPVRLLGGRKVVVMGLTVNVDVLAWTTLPESATTALSLEENPYDPTDARSGGAPQTDRTFHIEGLLAKGPTLTQGIHYKAPTADIALVNCHIGPVLFDSADHRDGTNGKIMNHPDLTQKYDIGTAGCKSLRIDGFTGSSMYQGLLFKDSTTNYPIRMRRVDLHAIEKLGSDGVAYAGHRMLWNHQPHPITVDGDSVWVQGHANNGWKSGVFRRSRYYDAKTKYERGVNAAGGEFGADPRTVGTFDSDASFAFYASRGHTIIRIPFGWEDIQPTLGGALDAIYLGRLKAAVNSCTSRGMRAILDLHNYCRYKRADGVTVVLGDGSLTEAHLNDVWTKLANEFKTDSLVEYGLMNEPHDIPGIVGTYTPKVTRYTFDSTVEGWADEDTTTPATVAVDTTTFRTGTGSLKISKTPNVTTYWQMRIASPSALGNLSAGGLTLSQWVFCPTGQAGWLARAIAQTTDAAVPDVNGVDVNLVEGAWNELRVELTLTQAQNLNKFIVQIMHNSPSTTAAVVFNLDDVTTGDTTSSKTPAQVWESASSAAVAAIRATGATGFCRVAGYAWSSAKDFWSIHPNWWIGDAESGPEGHYYPDPDHDGKFTETYQQAHDDAIAKGYASVPAKAKAEIGNFVDGCTLRGLRGLLGEVGWPNNITTVEWNAVGDAIYSALDAGYIDATYWAAGEQWGTAYELSIYTGTPQAVLTASASTIEAHPASSGYVLEPPLGMATDIDAVAHGSGTKPVVSTDASGSYTTWPDITGKIRLGAPAAGEYVPAVSVGASYKF